MKTIITLVCAALAAIAFAATEPNRPKTREEALRAMKQMSPQERAAKIAARRAAAERNLGGFLTFPATGNVVRVVNRQKLVGEDKVKALSDTICTIVGMAIEVVGADAPANPKEAARIDLVDDTTTPTLLIAPEDKFGTLNVGKLNDDRPSAELLRQRFAKEYWRVVCMVMGGFISDVKPCVMRNVFSLKDLDSDPSLAPSPVVFDKLQSTCRQLGITRPRRITYRRACLEGIAPMPTNDVQKAIWDKVHAIPKNPMKIEFDPQKGR